MALIHVEHLHLHATIGGVEEILKSIDQLTQKIMSTFAEIKREYETLKTAIAEEKQQIADALQALQNKITELETNIAQGGTVEERTQLVAEIKADTESIKGIIPDLPPPTEPTEGGTV